MSIAYSNCSKKSEYPWLTMTLGHSLEWHQEVKNGMMSIHELAKLSGISVRTLHYYDKIHLLKPCSIESNGYRKYDGDSLRRLQQILFYKEMDLPLKSIKMIMGQPQSDPKAVIRSQKAVLEAKQKRLTRLIDRMEHILKGDQNMDFSVFAHRELEEVLRSRLFQLEEHHRQALIAEYGSIDACMEQLMSNKARIIELAVKDYGSLDSYMDSLKTESSLPYEGPEQLQTRLDGIVEQIAVFKNRQLAIRRCRSL